MVGLKSLESLNLTNVYPNNNNNNKKNKNKKKNNNNNKVKCKPLELRSRVKILFAAVVILEKYGKCEKVENLTRNFPINRVTSSLIRVNHMFRKGREGNNKNQM
jgi:hypothetical protein